MDPKTQWLSGSKDTMGSPSVRNTTVGGKMLLLYPTYRRKCGAKNSSYQPDFLKCLFSYGGAWFFSTWRELSCTINLLQIQKQKQKIDGAT